MSWGWRPAWCGKPKTPVTTPAAIGAVGEKGVVTGGGSGIGALCRKAHAKHAASDALVTPCYGSGALATALAVVVGGNAHVAPRRLTSVDSAGRRRV